MRLAITRDVSPRFNECELTHLNRTPIDLCRAQTQHHQYVQALKDLGFAVLELPSEPDLPDSVFVEDAAVILPEVAVITQPGAASRKPETESIAQALSRYRALVHITPPGSLDGGDVLVLGKNIFVGLSTRSNQAAVDPMNQLLGKFGYQVQGVGMHDCLHLKTAVTRVDDHTLLINRKWVDVEYFEGFQLIDVDETEPFAANCLCAGEAIIFPLAFPRTAAKLKACGFQVKTVEADELAKAEGAVTCCSLIVEN